MTTPSTNESAAAPLLEASDLRLTLSGHPILQGVSLTLERGQVQCLMGPSGCGKTSVLRCLNFLEAATSGSIRFRGRQVGFRRGWLGTRRWDGPLPLRRYRAEVGMVFQGFYTWPHLTARDNLLLPLRRIRRLSAAEAGEVAEHMLSRVGLLEKAGTFPAQLSGGQTQRLAIARALAMEPSVLLLDEPTSSLDPELVQEVIRVIRELAGDGMTMLIVTHEIGLARSIAQRLMFMDQGRIVEAGSPAELVAHPQSPRLRSFLGSLLLR